MDILLSIGMIVKNESRCLEKCLNALEPLRRAIPCELVIADTGSTDGTHAIAEKYADILFDFPWVNDFSAARNAVMDRCSGKWYLTVDADEYLDPHIDDLLRLLRKPESEWPDGCLITVRNYLTPEMLEGACSDFLALRMARLGIGICYEGTIHESFRKNGNRFTMGQLGTLPGIVLNHDGYALESEEARKAKAKRNLDLLDKELEQHPDDLNCLGQCIESASQFPNKLVAYVVQSAEVLQHADKIALQGPSAPVVASHCALIGVNEHLPQAEAWIQWSRKHYPAHIATRLDTTFAEIVLEYERKHYVRLPELTERYLKAYDQYQKKDVPVVELATSVLRAAETSHSYKVRAIASIALEKLGKSKESLKALAGWPIHQLSGENLQDWVKALILHCDDSGAQASMVQTLRAVEADYMKSGSSPWVKSQHDSLQAICGALFVSKKADSGDEPEKPWHILLAAEGPFGIAARVMACTDAEEIARLLSAVEEWDAFPPQALAHALKHGALFPDHLSRQSVKWLQETALAVLEACEDCVPLLLARAEKTDFDSLSQTQLLYWLLTAALTREEVFSDGKAAVQLCEHYVHAAETYLSRCYSPEVVACHGACCGLNETDQFSFDYLIARAWREQGDSPAYIHALRSALRAAPQMKHFVKFLLDCEKHDGRKQVSPELLALAEQVRAILAQYPSDDPAVAALKQSPAYQKVAYLIEEPDAPSIDGVTQ